MRMACSSVLGSKKMPEGWGKKKLGTINESEERRQVPRSLHENIYIKGKRERKREKEREKEREREREREKVRQRERKKERKKERKRVCMREKSEMTDEPASVRCCFCRATSAKSTSHCASMWSSSSLAANNLWCPLKVYIYICV